MVSKLLTLLPLALDVALIAERKTRMQPLPVTVLSGFLGPARPPCSTAQPHGSLCAGQQWGRQVWMGL